MESLPVRKKVAVIYGGQSGEHEVSLISARLVQKMLQLSYTVELIGVTKTGQWYWQPAEEELEEPIKKLKICETRPLQIRPGLGIFYGDQILKIDCIFPIIHGTFGEDGRLQALLEFLGLPYAGCPFGSSALCMDKSLLKTVWAKEDLPILPFLLVQNYEMLSLSDSTLQSKFDHLGSTQLIAKPSSLGSSLGISKVESVQGLRMALEKIFELDSIAVLEPFGQFREIEVAVLGSANEVEVVQCLGEVCYDGAQFYDYETKYGQVNPLTLQVPAQQLTVEQTEKIVGLAKKAYLAGRCEGFARVDFFIDGKNPDFIYLNEINSLPGFTQVSLFPMMCLQSGISLKELGQKFIEDGIQRFWIARQRFQKAIL